MKNRKLKLITLFLTIVLYFIGISFVGTIIDTSINFKEASIDVVGTSILTAAIAGIIDLLPAGIFYLISIPTKTTINESFSKLMITLIIFNIIVFCLTPINELFISKTDISGMFIFKICGSFILPIYYAILAFMLEVGYGNE